MIPAGDFATALAALLEPLQRLAGLQVEWKDADPALAAALPPGLAQHANPYCLAVKADPSRLARCRRTDELDEGFWRARGWAPLERTCHAGVRERVSALRDGPTFVGSLFIGPFRGGDPAPAWLPPYDRERAAASAALAELLIGLVLERRSQARAAERARRAGEERIAAALEHIGRHLAAGLRAAAVARAVGLERTAFSRRFAAVVGEPFSLHLRQRLMAEARRRLVASPRRITDVALDLGFADPMAFSAAFRRAVGCSPQAFRRRALAAAP